MVKYTYYLLDEWDLPLMGPSRTIDTDESEWLNILRHLTVPTENAFFSTF